MDDNLGLEIIADLKQCDSKVLDRLNSSDFKVAVTKIVRLHGLTVLDSAVHDFDIGFTCIIALAESHIAIHTWPRERYVSLNIYVCNYLKDNSEIARHIYQEILNMFSPQDVAYNEVIRLFK